MSESLKGLIAKQEITEQFSDTSQHQGAKAHQPNAVHSQVQLHP